jgi:preprotein translocase subunit SecG
MSTFVLVLHIIFGIILILIILLQLSKGAGLGSIFGGGGEAVFGGTGGDVFLKKLTIVFAVAFMTTSLILAIISSRTSQESIVDKGTAASDQQTPPPSP